MFLILVVNSTTAGSGSAPFLGLDTASIALVIALGAALFTGWQTFLFKRMSDLQRQDLDLHRKEYDGEKRRFLWKESVNITRSPEISSG